MSRKKILWILLVVCFVLAGGYAWLSSRYVTPILMYHNIEPDTAQGVNFISPERFAEQMKYLADHHYHVVTAGEYAAAVIEGRRLPYKSVVITFDDGYESTYHNAFPILKKYGFPWTLFMISDFIARKDFMSLDQLKELVAAGVTIGCHTRHHLYLPGVLDAALLTDEVALSRKILEQKLGITIRLFSYPVGGFNDAIIKEVQQAGYMAAFTTNRGDFSNKDRWALTRIKVTGKDRGWIFGVKLSGFYNIFRKPKPVDPPMNNVSASLLEQDKR